MTTWYGYTPGDVVAGDSNADGQPDVFAPGATIEIWSLDRTAQIADLVDEDENPITGVQAGDRGRTIFGRPEDNAGSVWGRTTDANGETWWLFEPNFWAERVAGITPAENAYVKPAGGIPQTDLATAVGQKLDNAVPKTVVDAKGDLLVGSAADTVIRRPVGTDGQVLVADSTHASGLGWGAAGSGGPHAATHQVDGSDELSIAMSQVEGLGGALDAMAQAESRYWDAGSRTWSPRPAVADGVPVRCYSTHDATASQPPAPVTGDLWFRHPDAPTA